MVSTIRDTKIDGSYLLYIANIWLNAVNLDF